MKGLVWNRRGFNNVLAPTIAKLRALLRFNYYDFVFLCETKCNRNNVDLICRPFEFLFSEGMDVIDTKGGLWVG